MKVTHPFEPIYDKNSNVLILGSLPSVKSREVNFYYAHPQNRFWKILENIFNEKIEDSIESKKEFLLRNNIAIWDTIKSCDIEASSDASIKNVVVNDITSILNDSNIKAILCNGNASYKIFNKYFKDSISIPVVSIPSSSPANARFSLEKLTSIWKEEIEKARRA